MTLDGQNYAKELPNNKIELSLKILKNESIKTILPDHLLEIICKAAFSIVSTKSNYLKQQMTSNNFYKH